MYYMYKKEFIIDEIAGKITLTKYEGTRNRVYIPDEVEVIGDSAFRDKKFITEVYIPNNVKRIELDAFANCTALKKYTFLMV